MVLAITLAASAGACGTAGGAVTASACPGSTDAAPASPAYSAAILCLLNDQRRAARLPLLHLDSRLGAAAAGHSLAMRDRGFFGHQDPSGPVKFRVRSAGYLKRARRWLVGENIAWGSGALGSPASIMNGWMNSVPHRENILERRYRAVGIGVASGSPSDADDSAAATITTDFGRAKRAKHLRKRGRGR